MMRKREIGRREGREGMTEGGREGGGEERSKEGNVEGREEGRREINIGRRKRTAYTRTHRRHKCNPRLATLRDRKHET